MAIIAYSNAWGILRAGILDFPHLYRIDSFLCRLLNECVFEGGFEGFTESYWSTTPVALSEVEEGGLEVVTYSGCEGFAGGLRPILDQMAEKDPLAYQNIARLAAETSERDPFRDDAEHLHIVARRG